MVLYKISFVVPGYVVLSSTTKVSVVICRDISLAAETIKVISGSFVFLKGVGTQIITTSELEIPSNLSVAVKFLFLLFRLVNSDILEFGISGIWEIPLLRFSTFVLSKSIPVTENPTSDKAHANGNPT